MADQLQEEIQNHFQWLHRHPELALQEHETTAYIRAELQAIGIPRLPLGLATGVLAEIAGALPGPTIALRADIDALPIEETSGLSYSSGNRGCMHACGHDFHTAVLLGAAGLLWKKRASLPGRILLLFQPAEEQANGAQRVVDTGVLQAAQQIYGLHVAPELPAGVIAVKEGAEHAAVDRFTIEIQGTGCHAAHPNQGNDSILAAAQLVQAAQGIISRGIDPFDNAVLSVTSLHAGSTWNVIPAAAALEGTVRTLLPATRTFVRQCMQEVCTGVAQGTGTKVAFQWHAGCPATNNNPTLAQLVQDVAKRLGHTVQRALPTMGGEDFSLYQQSIPGVFFSVGVASPQPLHNPGFIANTAALGNTARLVAAIAEQGLCTTNERNDI